jgi:two-component system, LytTR family, sensor kinase
MTNQKLGFNDFWFRLIGIPLIGAFVPPVFFQISFQFNFEYGFTAFISIIYTFIYWQICRLVFIKANAKFPLMQQQRDRLYYIVLVCGFIIVTLCPFIHFFIEPLLGTNEYDALGLKKPSLFQIYAANVTLHLAIASIYESIRNFSLYETTLLEKEQLEKAQIISQLEGLKSQVNPHFLFNSLNTLISIIPEDSERSVRFVRQLSKIYRYFLETTDDKTVSLKQEMDFVNAYTFLLKERFGENLHIEIQDHEACNDCLIVPFSLQLLLENCIKHNIVSKDKPLYINILVNQHEITVKNNRQPKHQAQETTGVGLKNIAGRYQLLNNHSIKIDANTRFFSVTLPLLSAPVHE